MDYMKAYCTRCIAFYDHRVVKGYDLYGAVGNSYFIKLFCSNCNYYGYIGVGEDEEAAKEHLLSQEGLVIVLSNKPVANENYELNKTVLEELIASHEITLNAILRNINISLDRKSYDNVTTYSLNLYIKSQELEKLYRKLLIMKAAHAIFEDIHKEN